MSHEDYRLCGHPLQEARSRLLTEAIDVTSVSFAVGYQSPSQLRREYRRQLGVPPKEDAARLRSAGGESRARATPHW